MERRNFIKATSLATAGIAFTDLSAFAGFQNRSEVFDPLTSLWILNDDGSYGMKAGGIQLVNCYPAFDSQPIFPKKVEVNRTADGGTITYFLKDGKVILRFGKDNDSLVLSSILEMPVAPHYFYPLSFASITGADRFFKQGIGFAGPSGVFEFPKAPMKRESYQNNEAWSYDSYMTSGLLSASDESIAIGAYKHDNYLQRSTYFNRPYRFGLIDRHLNSNTLMFEAGFGTEEITINGSLEIPDIHFVSGNNPFATFQHFAQNIAKANQIKFKSKPRYQWCSWYEFEENYTQQHLDDFIDGLKKIKTPIPIQAIQIDDGYSQRGDWIIANNRFPKGVEHMVQTIKKAGYEQGIWVAPFMVSQNSKLFKDHPEWMLKDSEGKIIAEWNFHDNNMYVLDTTHPGAFEHLRTVFRTLRKWGITYYKTDFTDWGLRDRTKFQRNDNSKTSVQNFVAVMKMIREEIGQDSYWLACISPYSPFIGLADAVRFSNDVPAKWNDGSQGNLIQEGIACHYFQHVLWQNDPDTIFLRDNESNLNSTLTKDELYTIALWDGMLGGFITTSDRFHKVPEEYVKLYRFLQPGTTQMSCRFPFWASNKVIKTAVRDYADGKSWAVLMVNPTGETRKEEVSVKSLINKDKAWFFNWLPGISSPAGEKNVLSVELKAHQSVLFYVNIENRQPDKDYGLFGIKIKGI